MVLLDYPFIAFVHILRYTKHVERKPFIIPIYNPYINYLYSPLKPVSPSDGLYLFWQHFKNIIAKKTP